MTETKNIHEAINKVMGRVGYVQKEKAAALKYTFAGEAALIAALRPEMVIEQILMHCSNITDVITTEYQSGQGTRMTNVSLIGEWTFIHAPTGTSIVVKARGEGADSSDKAGNKAMTGSFKYALRQTFMIETGDDPDKEMPGLQPIKTLEYQPNEDEIVNPDKEIKDIWVAVDMPTYHEAAAMLARGKDHVDRRLDILTKQQLDWVVEHSKNKKLSDAAMIVLRERFPEVTE